MNIFHCRLKFSKTFCLDCYERSNQCRRTIFSALPSAGARGVCRPEKCVAVVSPQWAGWSSWASCSACGLGLQTRHRDCDSDLACYGNNQETRECFATNLCTGLMISGGRDTTGKTTVEVILAGNFSESCSLPSLSTARWFHTHNKDIICGGSKSNARSCDLLTNSGWRTKKTLIKQRLGHVSWSTKGGVLLMGGFYNGSEATTELVTWDGSNSQESFSLKYPTLYISISFLIHFQVLICSYACAIPYEERDSTVITGGYRSTTRVSQYKAEGWVGDLKSLNTGRYFHGCAHFTSFDQKVSLD